MTAARRPASRSHSASITVKTRAYDHIRRQILDAKLPVGAALSEYQLAAEIGVSRTPVREALKRLEHDGLVRSIARRGTFVAELSGRDIIDIYQVRTALESFAAGVAAASMEPATVTELLKELDAAQRRAATGNIEGAREHDIHMHKRIIASTGNTRLAQILSTLDDQVHRIRQRALSDPTRRGATLAEHRVLLEAIRKRDSGAAEKAMRAHLDSARDSAIRMALAGANF